MGDGGSAAEGFEGLGSEKTVVEGEGGEGVSWGGPLAGFRDEVDEGEVTEVGEVEESVGDVGDGEAGKSRVWVVGGRVVLG